MSWDDAKELGAGFLLWLASAIIFLVVVALLAQFSPGF